MALNANKIPSGGKRVQQPNLEEGTYPTRLVQVIGLGLQARDDWAGEAKAPCYQLYTTYEFGDEFTVDEDGNVQEDRPRWLSERINLFNLDQDKATSTKRYNALDPKGDNGGDWGALVGTPAMVTVGHKDGSGKNAGRVFDNIINVSKMRDKDAENAAELINPTLVFDANDDEPDVEVFNSLPDFLKDIIKSNLEYNGSALQAALGEEVAASGDDIAY